MDEFKADLHCHTTYSDSSVTPEWAVHLAKQAGLSAVAITDHDTFEGIKTAQKVGKEAGILIVPGVELSCYDYSRGRKVHLLVYNPTKPEVLYPICEYTTKERVRTGEIMLRRAVERFGIPEEMILRHKRGSVLYKQHIMHGLMDAGLADGIFGETFRKLFYKGEQCINEKMAYLDVHKVAAAAKESGGIVILAHPAEYRSEELMEELVAAEAINGVEVYHESASEEQQKTFAEFAKEKRLLVTGGTDFHGMYHKVPVPIGSFALNGKDEFLKIFPDKFF